MPARRPVYIDTTTGELTRFSATDTFANEVDFLTVTNPAAAAAGANDIPPGSPVYCLSAGQVAKAKADALSTAKVLALATETIPEDNGSGVTQTDGRLTLTTSQWDAITGQSGGLTACSKYYLDPATAGRLTTTAPSADGQILSPVGTAESSTVFEISIGTRIAL